MDSFTDLGISFFDHVDKPRETWRQELQIDPQKLVVEKTEFKASGAPKSTFSICFSQYHFFNLQCDTFVRGFDLNKIYRPENPSGYLYLRKKSFPEMH